MLGTIVNAAAIIVGGSFGAVFGSKLKERYSDIVLKAMALSVLLVGLKYALLTNEMLLVIISLSLGSLIGEFIDIEGRLNKLGENLQEKFSEGHSNLAEGFVMATLIYCIGSMAILGAIDSGVRGDHTILYAKAVLDGVSALVFASTLGFGVVLSSISVFIYQGSITLLASQATGILTDQAINELSAVGGLLIMTIGLNILGITKIKVGNMLPAVFIPVIYFAFVG
ncbi:MAG: DUF554 domain-containing protein [Clostridiales bacterium]|nr:DUF554 domain-containing protein [Clostridiales bacterium]